MKGVILAAGKGTRLYPVTQHIPKPLLQLANRITLEYAFDRLKELEIYDICIVVGEMENELRYVLKDGMQFGVNLTYVRQTEPKGLADAVSFAAPFVGTDNFVLYLGDAIYSENFGPFANTFRESGCANLNIVQPVADPSRFGVAYVEGERILKLVEKPANPQSNLAMAGLYFFTQKLWAVLPDLQPSSRGEYEITDAIQMLIDQGETVLAGIYTGKWFDTGTLDSFLESSRFLTDNGHLFAEEAILKADHVGKHVVLGKQARVVCSFIEDTVVLPGANIEVKGKIKHALVGGKIQSSKSIENQVMYS